MIIGHKTRGIATCGYSVSSPRHYYSLYGLLVVLIPGALFLIVWGIFEKAVISHLVISSIPPDFFIVHDKNLILSYLFKGIEPSTLSGENQTFFREALEYYQRLESDKGLYRFLIVALISLPTAFIAYSKVSPQFNARVKLESLIMFVLILSSILAILTTIGIVVSLLLESWLFFQRESLIDVVFGTHWSPQTAIREDQVGSTGSFGFLPLIWGTLYITLVALLVAVPIGLIVAIFLAEYVQDNTKKYLKPTIELLAGIPTIVYGFLAVKTVAPFMKDFFQLIGLEMEYESVILAGVVMGVMIIPFVSSLSEDTISAVPKSIKDGSMALGSTKFEMIWKVVLPAAMPGITGSVLLAFSRAVGETMIVVLAAGLTAKFAVNPLESVTTITVQIVTILVGDQEFDSSKTLSAFGLGLCLFILTLVFNIISSIIAKRSNHFYE